MSQEQQQQASEDAEPSSSGTNQQQQNPAPECHAGQGSDSIMKELREWENRRASHSGGKRRNGPG